MDHTLLFKGNLDGICEIMEFINMEFCILMNWMSSRLANATIPKREMDTNTHNNSMHVYASLRQDKQLRLNWSYHNRFYVERIYYDFSFDTFFFKWIFITTHMDTHTIVQCIVVKLASWQPNFTAFMVLYI